MVYWICHLDGWKLDLAVALALGYVVVEKRPSGTVYMCWEPGKTLAYKGIGTIYIDSTVDGYRLVRQLSRGLLCGYKNSLNELSRISVLNGGLVKEGQLVSGHLSPLKWPFAATLS